MRSPRFTCRCGKTVATRAPRPEDGLDRRLGPHQDPSSGRPCDDVDAPVDPYTGAWL
jgi:hypothetical protein